MVRNVVIILTLFFCGLSFACRDEVADEKERVAFRALASDVTHLAHGWDAAFKRLKETGVIKSEESILIAPRHLEGGHYGTVEQLSAAFQFLGKHVGGQVYLQSAIRISHWLAGDWGMDPSVVFAALVNRRPTFGFRSAQGGALLVDSARPGAKPVESPAADVLSGMLYSRFPAFGEIDSNLIEYRELPLAVEQVLSGLFYTGMHAQMTYVVGTKGYDSQVLAIFRVRALMFGNIGAIKKKPTFTTAEWKTPPFVTGPSPHVIRCDYSKRAPHAFVLPHPGGTSGQHAVALLSADGVPVGGAYAIGEKSAGELRRLMDAYMGVMGPTLYANGSILRAAAQNAFLEIEGQVSDN
ncbi:MAG: hypothetical protein R3B54_07560 [Bdellovibrionota bacterium]